MLTRNDEFVITRRYEQFLKNFILLVISVYLIIKLAKCDISLSRPFHGSILTFIAISVSQITEQHY